MINTTQQHAFNTNKNFIKKGGDGPPVLKKLIISYEMIKK